MIFRRRRTRIEIEHTTVKMQGGVLYPFVAPPAPPPVEATLARVLPFPAPAPNDLNATASVTTMDGGDAQENRR